MNEQIAKELVERFVEAFNAKDIDAFCGCFKEDGDFVNILGEMAKGREAIAEMHKFPFTTVQSKAITSVERMALRELDSHLVCADVWWSTVGSLTRTGESLPTRLGLLYFVIEIKNSKGSIVSGRNFDYTNFYGRDAVPSLQEGKH